MKSPLLSPKLKTRLFALIMDHPTVWLILGTPLFVYWAGVIPVIAWNAIEMMIGQNLLMGHGYIVAPLDPPALWRPMLGSFACAAVEVFNRDPLIIFQVVYTVSLAIFMVCVFYTAHKLWGRIAAHAACLFVLTSPGLTSLLALHLHGLSHIVFLAAVGPAILCTVIAFSRPRPVVLVATGLTWALTYLARPEAILFVAATFLLLLHSAWKSGRLRLCIWMLGAFSAIWLPTALYQTRMKSQYHLWGPALLVTFYNSEGWATGVNDEALGFEAASKKYGTLESHDFSFVKMIARHPEALSNRFQINFPQVLSLFRRNRLCNLAWLAFLPFLVIDMRLRERRTALYIYLSSMVLFPVMVVLVRHVDPRYLVIAIPSLLLLSVGGVAVFSRIVVASPRRWVSILGALCLLAGTARIGRATFYELAPLLRSGAYGRAHLPIRQAEALARGFLHYASGPSPKVLLITDPPPPGPSDVFQFLVSYFAGTAIPWPDSSVYPRDKIFSMVAKLPQYEFVPQRFLYTTDILTKRKPLGPVALPELEPYYLFPYENGSPAGRLTSDKLNAVASILRRSYPQLVGNLERSAQ